MTPEMRKAALALAAQQRDVEFIGGETEFVGGTPFELNDQSTAIDREFYDFYRTARGNSPDTTIQPTLSSNVRFMNFYPFEDIETISPRPMLFITGDQAHSREFSEQAHQLAAEPKQTGARSRCRPRQPLRPNRPHPLRHVGHLLPDQPGHRRMTADFPTPRRRLDRVRRKPLSFSLFHKPQDLSSNGTHPDGCQSTQVQGRFTSPSRQRAAISRVMSLTLGTFPATRTSSSTTRPGVFITP